MSTIDIRKVQPEDAEYIRFEDVNDFRFTATRIRKLTGHNEGYVAIEQDDGEESDVTVHSEEQARHLIQALEKAIELGWLK